MLNPLQYQFTNTLKSYGYDAEVNGLNQVRILLKEHEEGTNTNTSDYKYMMFENGEIKQGDTVTIFNDNWIVLHENITINDVYTKVIIKRCNYNVKSMIEDKLYLFYSIVEGEKFSISESGMINMSTDRILVTLPNTVRTRQLKKQFTFILFGQKWEIQGVDYTNNELLTLHCKFTLINNTTDDLQNAIAERYNDDGDKLKGNTKPILPFDPIPIATNNIISIATFADINVDYDTLINDIALPYNIIVTLDNSTTRELPITWNTSTYDGTVANTYNLIGDIGLIEGVTNTTNLVASVNIIVAEEPVIGGIITYTLTGSDTLKVLGAQKYTAKKFIDGVQDTTAKFDWTISNETMAEIWEATDTTLDLDGKNKNVGQFFTITATDRVSGEIVTKQVKLVY